MSKLTALMGFPFLAVSAAWAQTTPPAPGNTSAPGGTTDAAPADPTAAGTDLTQYWWIILLVIIAVAAIWYFSRSRSRNRV